MGPLVATNRTPVWYVLTIYFLETNTVITLAEGWRTPLVAKMRQLAKELSNAGWGVTQDLSGAVTGYPQMTFEANTGAEIQLQVSHRDEKEGR